MRNVPATNVPSTRPSYKPKHRANFRHPITHQLVTLPEFGTLQWIPEAYTPVNEFALSLCAYGCKVYVSELHGELLVWHNANYGCDIKEV